MKSYAWLAGLLALVLLIGVMPVQADEIELKDGSVIKGKVTEEKPGESFRVRLTDGSEMVYPVSKIESVRYGRSKTAEADEPVVAQKEIYRERYERYEKEGGGAERDPTLFTTIYGAYAIGIGDAEDLDTFGGGFAFHLDFIRLYGEFLATTDDFGITADGDATKLFFYGGGADIVIPLMREGDVVPYLGGGGGFYGFSDDEFEEVEMAYVVEGIGGVRIKYLNLFAKFRRFVWTEADFADGWDTVQFGAGVAF